MTDPNREKVLAKERSMSDTPRTDTMVTGNSSPSVDEYEDLAGFARQLERELAAARAEIEKLKDSQKFLHGERMAEMKRAEKAEAEAERNREDAERLRYCYESGEHRSLAPNMTYEMWIADLDAARRAG